MVIESVNNYGSLCWASEKIRGNKNIVMEAVKNNGHEIQYASNDLKNDKEVVITALKENKMAFTYIGKDIKEKFFPKEKNYSAESIEFQLVRPWERLEKEITKDNPWNKEKDTDKVNAWTEKINSDKDNQWER